MTETNEPTISTEEAARRLEISDVTVRTYCREGYILATRKAGKRGDWQIPESEITRLLNQAMDRQEGKY